ncbi:hypothetical protein WCLP8_4570011 [uncultured Gammaproteobacteria bacterium]
MPVDFAADNAHAGQVPRGAPGKGAETPLAVAVSKRHLIAPWVPCEPDPGHAGVGIRNQLGQTRAMGRA